MEAFFVALLLLFIGVLVAAVLDISTRLESAEDWISRHRDKDVRGKE